MAICAQADALAMVRPGAGTNSFGLTKAWSTPLARSDERDRRIVGEVVAGGASVSVMTHDGALSGAWIAIRPSLPVVTSV